RGERHRTREHLAGTAIPYLFRFATIPSVLMAMLATCTTIKASKRSRRRIPERRRERVLRFQALHILHIDPSRDCFQLERAIIRCGLVANFDAVRIYLATGDS